MDAKSLRSSRRRRGAYHGVDIENAEIPKLKDFCLETDLSGDVLVVPPEGEEGWGLAERIAQVLGGQAAVQYDTLDVGGEIRIYDGTGRLIAGREVGSEVTYLRTVAGESGEQVLCATAAGKVMAFRA